MEKSIHENTRKGSYYETRDNINAIRYEDFFLNNSIMPTSPHVTYTFIPKVSAFAKETNKVYLLHVGTATLSGLEKVLAEYDLNTNTLKQIGVIGEITSTSNSGIGSVCSLHYYNDYLYFTIRTLVGNSHHLDLYKYSLDTNTYSLVDSSNFGTNNSQAPLSPTNKTLSAPTWGDKGYFISSSSFSGNTQRESISIIDFSKNTLSFLSYEYSTSSRGTMDIHTFCVYEDVGYMIQRNNTTCWLMELNLQTGNSKITERFEISGGLTSATGSTMNLFLLGNEGYFLFSFFRSSDDAFSLIFNVKQREFKSSKMLNFPLFTGTLNSMIRGDNYVYQIQGGSIIDYKVRRYEMARKSLIGRIPEGVDIYVDDKVITTEEDKVHTIGYNDYITI